MPQVRGSLAPGPFTDREFPAGAAKGSLPTLLLSSPQREAAPQFTEHFLGSSSKEASTALLHGSLYCVCYSAGRCEPCFCCVFLRVTGAVHTDGVCTPSLSNGLGHSTHYRMNEGIFIFYIKFIYFI